MAGTKTHPAGKDSRAGPAASGKSGKSGRKGATGKAQARAAANSAPAQEEAPVRRKRYGWLWLILPVLVAAAGAWAGLQYLEEHLSRADRLEARIVQLEELQRQRAEDAALLVNEAQDAQRAAERVRDALEARLGAAERALEAIGRQPAGQEAGWMLDAADRLLALADRQNRFARDYAGAALAVREALELLEQLGAPRYGALRATLEEQARSLERIPARDIKGVVVRLGALLSRVEGLEPVARPLPSAAAQTEELPAEGWGRAVASTRRALRSLITVRRADSGAGALLSETDTDTLRRLLAAELHLARLAYIQGDLQAYSAALLAARGRLARLYAPDNPDVADTQDDIDQLLEAGRARQTPDIAVSLERFRALRLD